jgi:hypothetical protein
LKGETILKLVLGMPLFIMCGNRLKGEWAFRIVTQLRQNRSESGDGWLFASSSPLLLSPLSSRSLSETRGINCGFFKKQDTFRWT